MAPGALKKTRAQQANDADKPRPSVRFAETKKEKAAVAAEEAERREELEDALLDDPYFNSLDPGYWQHFRAWCIFFFRYFAFLVHLFADWLWRTIPWVVCGLWDACTSRNGRRWIVGVVVLRAAIFCRDVGYPGVFAPAVCTLNEDELQSSGVTHRTLSDAILPLAKKIDAVFDMDATKSFRAHPAYKAAKSWPLYVDITSPGVPCVGRTSTCRNVAETVDSSLVAYDKLRRALVASLLNDLKTYRAEMTSILTAPAPGEGNRTRDWIVRAQPPAVQPRVGYFIECLTHGRYVNTTSAAVGLATHRLLSTFSNGVEALLETPAVADDWSWFWKLQPKAYGRFTVGDGVRRRAAHGIAWKKHVDKLRLFVESSQRGRPGGHQVPKEQADIGKWALYPVQCGQDVSGKIVVTEGLEGVQKLADKLIRVLETKKVALEAKGLTVVEMP